MLNTDKSQVVADLDLVPRPGFIQNGRIPLVYSSEYDFSCLEGIGSVHPLQPFKRGQIFTLLSARLGFSSGQTFEADQICQRDLDLVHSRQYINMISRNPNYAARVMSISEIASFRIDQLQEKLLRPIWQAAGGTVLAAELAQQYQWAINLSGGFHHARESAGAGFCFIADTAIAAIKHVSKNQSNKVLVVDLDAHRGDGVQHISGEYSAIEIFDMYNAKTFPGHFNQDKRRSFEYPLDPAISDSAYLNLLYQELPRAILSHCPNLIIYNAGTDVWRDDLIGGMVLSEEAIYQRDHYVFRQAFMHRVPIAMVLSGGYSPLAHNITAESICQLRRELLT